MSIATPRLMCVDCKIAGRERYFATASGYASHVENYHGGKPSDTVNFFNTSKPRHEDMDHTELCTFEECHD